jgi:hypothetical protein
MKGENIMTTTNLNLYSYPTGGVPRMEGPVADTSNFKGWSDKVVDTTPTKKHNHYFKDVSNLKTIDVYRVLNLFAVTDPCIGHAIKKLLVAGGRGAGKSIDKDIQEAIDSLVRWQAIQLEDKSDGI